MAQKEYELNIDPRILELLGPNLYTNIYYVLAELIANAYDANAKNVYIIGGDNHITVEDDGHGMSYTEGDINKYLNVAHETRRNDEDSYVNGSGKTRKKMGRKGVGKLAALSVSENVKIQTIKNKEKSGFILSRNIKDDRKLTPISENEISFQHITTHGTSIVMEDPQYDLHKTISAARKNILRMFPLVDENFKIHLQIGKKHEVIDCFEKDIIKDLGGLYTIGDEFKYLHDHLNPQIKDITDKQLSTISKKESSIDIKLELKQKNGDVSEYLLSIKGWLGAYRTTKGRKLNQVDFPDNFISLVANKKLGEFNILPDVGKNALIEVYIVGQIHVDIFEDSTLPDMALSNRQGYKTDDKRYIKTRNIIKTRLLPEIIALRSKWAALNNHEKDKKKNEKNKNLEEKLKQEIDSFKKKASKDLSKAVIKSLEGKEEINQESIEKTTQRIINQSLPEMGIKSKVDNNKKELLISHNGGDKSVSDFIFQMLLHTGIPAESIIYTSNDSAETRIPESQPIYDYLRDFFVNSYSDQKIYALYITSNNMSRSWPCVSEVGAGWITKSEHNIININDFQPSEPLNVRKEWASLEFKYDEDQIHMSERAVDVLSEKLIHICKYLDRQPKSKDDIKAEIKRNIHLS